MSSISQDSDEIMNGKRQVIRAIKNNDAGVYQPHYSLF